MNNLLIEGPLGQSIILREFIKRTSFPSDFLFSFLSSLTSKPETSILISLPAFNSYFQTHVRSPNFTHIMARLFKVFRGPITPAQLQTPVRAARPPPPCTPFQRRRKPRVPGAPQEAQKVLKPKYAGICCYLKDGKVFGEDVIQLADPFSLYDSPLKYKSKDDDFRKIHADHAKRFVVVYRQSEFSAMR